MKRTTTEIAIEVEETVVVRMRERTSNAESELDNFTNERPPCPFCGQPMHTVIEVKKGELEK